MAVTCDDILSNYHFDSKLYSENTDPTDLSNPLVSTSPSYPIPTFQPNRNRFLDHDYSKIVSVILSSPVQMFDFPVRVAIKYYDVMMSRRQRIYFNYLHSFLSLYNNSDFIKIIMHNARILGKSELTIDLPPDYFVEPKFLFVFCGTLKLKDICLNNSANTLDFYSFLYTASYLMIDDRFLFNLLQIAGSLDFKLNGSFYHIFMPFALRITIYLTP